MFAALFCSTVSIVTLLSPHHKPLVLLNPCRNARIDHVGSDGSTVGQRIKAAGYTTFPQAENIAMGQNSAYQVGNTALEHCKVNRPVYDHYVTTCNQDNTMPGAVVKELELIC
jgi:hypothetical protein